MSINKNTTLDLNGPVLEFQVHPQSVTATGINSAQFTGFATAVFPSATTGTTTSLITATYNGYPVRGYLYYPTSANVGSALDVVVLYHGTITSQGVTPADAASTFMQIALNKVDLKDKIIFSVAYPQDAIPAYVANSALATQQFPGLDLSTFYIGDNIVYAEAALLWVKNTLPSYLTANNIPKTIDKVYTFGHSQGAYLVHRLNTMHTVDGVIANAPGPIDLLDRCSGDQNTENITCNKINVGIGSTTADPDAYLSRSLKSFITGTKSPALFTQALDDESYQVNLMQNTLEPGLSTCSNCASMTFNYYGSGGHDAFAINYAVQNDIRDFVGAQGNPASNTGSLSYQWYNSDHGLITDGQWIDNTQVTGAGTTILTLEDATSDQIDQTGFYLTVDYVPSAYVQPIGVSVTAGTARSTPNAVNDGLQSNSAILTVRPTLSVTLQPQE
tara:strand:- start:22260 stop:23594 length:1335 start_codon:yes stop_codon:yes gene_type:complete